MRLISVNRCQPGEKLAKTIYNSNGNVLVGEGVELTRKMLDRLRSLNVSAIYIEDERTSDILIEDIVSEETRREAMSVIFDSFRAFQEEPRKWQQAFTSQQVGRRLKEVMKSIVDELKQNRSAMNLLGTICGVDHYVYSHSFNVALYSTAVGLKAGLSDKEIVEIGIGGLLHDVGKMAIPLEILKKPGKLTDEEYAVIKTHTELGFELLRRQDEIPLLAAHCAYQHHERLDGSGYPRGLKGDEIHHFAKIMAVCDVFDALTSDRVYRPAILPHEAMELIYAGADSLYDKQIVEEFRNTIALYPLGLVVTLNTGEVGVVVDYNRGAPSRPVVRVLRDAQGRVLDKLYEIDLSKRLNIVITACDTFI